MHILGLYFGWPDGAVYGNLVASVVCAVAVWWRIRAKMIAHHIQQRREHAARHEDLKAHITATVTAAARQQKRLAPRTPARPGGDPE